MPRLLDSKARLLAHAADSIKLKVDTATLRDAAAEIEWRKTSRLSIAQYATRDRSLPTTLPMERMEQLQRAYESLKDERRQIDFEDVLLAAAGMIEAEPRVAQQVREQYRFFVVDEYQDVSPLQHDLLQLWLGDRDDVCVVGDASQTIYSFAGASPDYLLGFAAEHEDAVVVRLEQNYRSTPPIIDTANRLMRGRPGALSLTPASDLSGPAPVVTGYDSDAAEARGVANAIAAETRRGNQARANRRVVPHQRAVPGHRDGTGRSGYPECDSRCHTVLRPARGQGSPHAAARCDGHHRSRTAVQDG